MCLCTGPPFWIWLGQGNDPHPPFLPTAYMIKWMKDELSLVIAGDDIVFIDQCMKTNEEML